MDKKEDVNQPISLFHKIVEKIIDERVFDKAYQKTKMTSDYDAWVREATELSGEISNYLGPDKDALYRYEELLSFRKGELVKNAYIQGFRDGVCLLKELYNMKE